MNSCGKLRCGRRLRLTLFEFQVVTICIFVHGIGVIEFDFFVARDRVVYIEGSENHSLWATNVCVRHTIKSDIICYICRCEQKKKDMMSYISSRQESRHHELHFSNTEGHISLATCPAVLTADIVRYISKSRRNAAAWVTYVNARELDTISYISVCCVGAWFCCVYNSWAAYVDGRRWKFMSYICGR